jgi:hypothetical protein
MPQNIPVAISGIPVYDARENNARHSASRNLTAAERSAAFRVLCQLRKGFSLDRIYKE